MQRVLSFRILQLCLMALLLSLLTSCGSSRVIVNGLDEKEANEILVFLSGKGIDATKVQSLEGGGGGATKVIAWDVKVPESQANEAMALLNQAGLPRRRGQGLLDIFSGGGLVPSELQEKIRYQAGLAEQIASTIRKIDGILDAEVQISVPEEDPLNPNAAKKKITASVYVKHNGVLDDPNTHLTTKIKRLVSASVPSLDYDNVTVIGDRVRYPGELRHEERQYVNIWTILVGKESVTRFRIVFFSFMLGLLALLGLLVWICWKVSPILAQYGGWRKVFKMEPLSLESSAKVAETKPKEEGDEENPDASQEDQDIDEQR